MSAGLFSLSGKNCCSPPGDGGHATYCTACLDFMGSLTLLLHHDGKKRERESERDEEGEIARNRKRERRDLII